MWNPCICEEYESDTILFVLSISCYFTFCTMSKCVITLPNIGLFLTSAFFTYIKRNPKTSVELLRIVISVTTRRFFSVKLLVFFPFLDAHYRALEGKAIAVSTDSYFSLLMHDVLLLRYLSNTLTVTNGNLAQVRSKWNTLAKYFMLARARQGTLQKFLFYSYVWITSFLRFCFLRNVYLVL